MSGDGETWNRPSAYTTRIVSVRSVSAWESEPMQFSVLTQPGWAGASMTPVAEAIHSITRKTPRGTKIARWYWPESHTPFSPLPGCLAARAAGRTRSRRSGSGACRASPSRSAAAKNGGRLDLPRDCVSGVTRRFPHISARGRPSRLPRVQGVCAWLVSRRGTMSRG